MRRAPMLPWVLVIAGALAACDPAAAALSTATPTDTAAPPSAPIATATPPVTTTAVATPAAAYVACGCGCCGGIPPDKVCLYHARGDSLAKVEAVDHATHMDPLCAAAGCAMGTEYAFCD